MYQVKIAHIGVFNIVGLCFLGEQYPLVKYQVCQHRIFSNTDISLSPQLLTLCCLKSITKSVSFSSAYSGIL